MLFLRATIRHFFIFFIDFHCIAASWLRLSQPPLRHYFTPPPLR
jgi:hypothetical protein